MLFDAIAQSIGVNYGIIADNLPPAIDVITLYTTNGGKMRMFDPNQATLQALKGSNIVVIVGVVNNDLQGLATSPTTANTWVQTSIIPYPDVKISYIAVGNEIKPSDPLVLFVGPAIQNLNNAITASNLQIKVSTAINMSLLGNSYPLTLHLQAHLVIVQIGGANLTVIVTESGWPSDGDSGVAAIVDNAGTYYKNLISHVKNGTPRKPGPLETYLFAMFDEDKKGPVEIEKHFGLFSPTKEPKYQLTFT
ncbi:hypothetical protein ACB098_08G160700 [Castanea mollissima]